MGPFTKQLHKLPEIWAVAWGEPGCGEAALALALPGTIKVDTKNLDAAYVAQDNDWTRLVPGKSYLVIVDGRPRAMSNAEYAAEYEHGQYAKVAE
jgi:hypothetical protein